MSKKALIHKANDMFGQDVVNRAWEKAWEKGQHKPTLKQVNDEWKKYYGKGEDKKYHRTPKYDPCRGSGGGEGFGKLINEN